VPARTASPRLDGFGDILRSISRNAAHTPA
jgi:hypothetical protein